MLQADQLRDHFTTRGVLGTDVKVVPDANRLEVRSNLPMTVCGCMDPAEDVVDQCNYAFTCSRMDKVGLMVS